MAAAKKSTVVGMEVLAKMAVATMGFDPSVAKKGGETPLGRIYGTADHLLAKKDKDGNPIIGIGGQFQGDNYKSGMRARSGVAYLPPGIHEQIVSAVDTGELDEKDKPVYRSVKFAMEIIAIPSSNPHGYSYKAKHLIDTEDDDPLDDLANSLPALPEPEGA
jgi:hypothetical protein